MGQVFWVADVCRGAIVFLNSYMSLPTPYIPTSHHRAQLPVPSWFPQTFLHHRQEWPMTSPYPSATSRRYDRQPPAMELNLDFLQNTCCENDWDKTVTYGGFVSSWAKHRWMFVCCDLGQWVSKAWVWEFFILEDEDQKWANIFMLLLLSAAWARHDLRI